MTAPAAVWHRIRRSGLMGLLLTALVVLSFRSAVADWYDVPTGSMQPTILVGDRIAVDKLAYDVRLPLAGTRLMTVGDPVPGEVIICSSPADGTRLVKRVVAGPGDTVALRRGRLVINGEPLRYGPADPALGADYGAGGEDMLFFTEDLGERSHVVAYRRGPAARRDFGPVTVAADSYFVMGDNRDRSADSRVWGAVPRENITARVRGLAFSLDRDDHWKPRWDRVMRGLD